MQGLWRSELIDTQWDVNLFSWNDDGFVRFGINRYIVGCKCGIDEMDLEGFLELIDTQWDVNMTAVKLKRYGYGN